MLYNKLFDRAKYPFGGSLLEKIVYNKVIPVLMVETYFFAFIFVFFVFFALVLPKSQDFSVANSISNINFTNKVAKFDSKNFPFHSKINNSDVKKSDYIKILDNSFPSVKFSEIRTTRDVSRIFFGKNNFLSLAAEMEGFRGDLHKDPAVGLNIGFGYNVTKKLGRNDSVVKRDLLSIGISPIEVEHIIAIAQLPQSKLEEGIDTFYKYHPHYNNQLISIKQGLSLLYANQSEYMNYARDAFPKSFDRMGKNQKEVLTYSAYKAGQGSLMKYRLAINKSNKLYEKKSSPSLQELQSIAGELNFYYKKDGKKKVLDKRANLIAKTFVHQDYLGNHVGVSSTKHTNDYLDSASSIKSGSTNKIVAKNKKH